MLISSDITFTILVTLVSPTFIYIRILYYVNDYFYLSVHSVFLLFTPAELAENRATHFRQEKGGLGPPAYNAAVIPCLSRRMYAQMDNMNKIRSPERRWNDRMIGRSTALTYVRNAWFREQDVGQVTDGHVREPDAGQCITTSM